MQRYVFYVCLLAMQFSTSVFAYPKCSVEKIIGDCRQYGLARPIFKNLSNGTFVINNRAVMNEDNPHLSDRTFKAEIAKITQLSPINQKRIEKDFSGLVLPTFRRMVQDYDIPDSSKEEMIRRIDAVKISFIENKDPRCSREIPLGAPGLYYNLLSHKIVICPAAQNSDRNTLLRGLSHELAHVIEARSLKQQQLMIDESSIMAIKNCGQLSAEDRKILIDLLKGKTLISSNQELASILSGCKIGTPIGKAIPSSTNHDSNPETMTCLTKLYRPVMQKYWDYYLRTRPPNMSQEEIEEKLKSNMFEIPTVIEHQADIIGAKTYAKIVAITKPKASEVLDSMQLFIQSACLENDLDLKNPGDWDPTKQNHPRGKDRLLIYLEQPEIQQSLACQELEGSACGQTARNHKGNEKNGGARGTP